MKTVREEFRAKKVMLKNLGKILGKNRTRAKDILSFLFNDEIMSEIMYKIRMSQAEQVRDFIEGISKMKMT